jgi:hypothetical protein
VKIHLLALLAISATACAGRPGEGVPDPTFSQVTPLAVKVSREVDPDGHLYALVQIQNRSDHRVCIDRDALDNGSSFAMHFDLRRRGRSIGFRNPGYIPPPLLGISTLSPGATVERRFGMSNRFAVTEAELVSYRDLQVSARFDTRDCAGSSRSEVRTGWEPFR